MRAGLKRIVLLFGCGMVFAISACAGRPLAATCAEASPKPFAAGQPFVLKDPRTGLLLYVESDGRHMAAIARNGTIVWHRDLFADPSLERVFVPPPQTSPEQWKQKADSILAHLQIDRIGIEPDCALSFIDSRLPAPLHGHYIRVGTGTYIVWLLDAKTGDLKMEEIN